VWSGKLSPIIPKILLLPFSELKFSQHISVCTRGGRSVLLCWRTDCSVAHSVTLVVTLVTLVTLVTVVVTLVTLVVTLLTLVVTLLTLVTLV
jgi:hypothetical protein